jgi:hypothetical protein
MQTALYYPYLRIKDEGLLKRALLFWDQVEVITPFHDVDKPEDKSLWEATDLVGPVRGQNKVFPLASVLLSPPHSPTPGQASRAIRSTKHWGRVLSFANCSRRAANFSPSEAPTLSRCQSRVLETPKGSLLTPRPAFDTRAAMFGEPQNPILPHPRSVHEMGGAESKFLSIGRHAFHPRHRLSAGR